MKSPRKDDTIRDFEDLADLFEEEEQQQLQQQQRGSTPLISAPPSPQVQTQTQQQVHQEPSTSRAASQQQQQHIQAQQQPQHPQMTQYRLQQTQRKQNKHAVLVEQLSRPPMVLPPSQMQFQQSPHQIQRQQQPNVTMQRTMSQGSLQSSRGQTSRVHLTPQQLSYHSSPVKQQYHGHVQSPARNVSMSPQNLQYQSPQHMQSATPPTMNIRYDQFSANSPHMINSPQSLSQPHASPGGPTIMYITQSVDSIPSPYQPGSITYEVEGTSHTSPYLPVYSALTTQQLSNPSGHSLLNPPKTPVRIPSRATMRNSMTPQMIPSPAHPPVVNEYYQESSNLLRSTPTPGSYGNQGTQNILQDTVYNAPLHRSPQMESHCYTSPAAMVVDDPCHAKNFFSDIQSEPDMNCMEPTSVQSSVGFEAVEQPLDATPMSCVSLVEDEHNSTSPYVEGVSITEEIDGQPILPANTDIDISMYLRSPPAQRHPSGDAPSTAPGPIGGNEIGEGVNMEDLGNINLDDIIFDEGMLFADFDESADASGSVAAAAAQRLQQSRKASLNAMQIPYAILQKTEAPQTTQQAVASHMPRAAEPRKDGKNPRMRIPTKDNPTGMPVRRKKELEPSSFLKEVEQLTKLGEDKYDRVKARRAATHRSFAETDDLEELESYDISRRSSLERRDERQKSEKKDEKVVKKMNKLEIRTISSEDIRADKTKSQTVQSSSSATNLSDPPEDHYEFHEDSEITRETGKRKGQKKETRRAKSKEITETKSSKDRKTTRVILDKSDEEMSSAGRIPPNELQKLERKKSRKERKREKMELEENKRREKLEEQKKKNSTPLVDHILPILDNKPKKKTSPGEKKTPKLLIPDSQMEMLLGRRASTEATKDLRRGASGSTFVHPIVPFYDPVKITPPRESPKECIVSPRTIITPTDKQELRMKLHLAFMGVKSGGNLSGLFSQTTPSPPKPPVPVPAPVPSTPVSRKSESTATASTLADTAPSTISTISVSKRHEASTVTTTSDDMEFGEMQEHSDEIPSRTLVNQNTKKPVEMENFGEKAQTSTNASPTSSTSPQTSTSTALAQETEQTKEVPKLKVPPLKLPKRKGTLSERLMGLVGNVKAKVEEAARKGPPRPPRGAFLKPPADFVFGEPPGPSGVLEKNPTPPKHKAPEEIAILRRNVQLREERQRAAAAATMGLIPNTNYPYLVPYISQTSSGLESRMFPQTDERVNPTQRRTNMENVVKRIQQRKNSREKIASSSSPSSPSSKSPKIVVEEKRSPVSGSEGTTEDTVGNLSKDSEKTITCECSLKAVEKTGGVQAKHHLIRVRRVALKLREPEEITFDATVVKEEEELMSAEATRKDQPSENEILTCRTPREESESIDCAFHSNHEAALGENITIADEKEKISSSVKEPKNAEITINSVLHKTEENPRKFAKRVTIPLICHESEKLTVTAAKNTAISASIRLHPIRDFTTSLVLPFDKEEQSASITAFVTKKSVVSRRFELSGSSQETLSTSLEIVNRKQEESVSASCREPKTAECSLELNLKPNRGNTRHAKTKTVVDHKMRESVTLSCRQPPTAECSLEVNLKNTRSTVSRVRVNVIFPIMEPRESISLTTWEIKDTETVCVFPQLKQKEEHGKQKYIIKLNPKARAYFKCDEPPKIQPLSPEKSVERAQSKAVLRYRTKDSGRVISRQDESMESEEDDRYTDDTLSDQEKTIPWAEIFEEIGEAKTINWPPNVHNQIIAILDWFYDANSTHFNAWEVARDVKQYVSTKGNCPKKLPDAVIRRIERISRDPTPEVEGEQLLALTKHVEIIRPPQPILPEAAPAVRHRKALHKPLPTNLVLEARPVSEEPSKKIKLDGPLVLKEVDIRDKNKQEPLQDGIKQSEENLRKRAKYRRRITEKKNAIDRLKKRKLVSSPSWWRDEFPPPERDTTRYEFTIHKYLSNAAWKCESSWMGEIDNNPPTQQAIKVWLCAQMIIRTIPYEFYVVLSRRQLCALNLVLQILYGYNRVGMKLLIPTIAPPSFVIEAIKAVHTEVKLPMNNYPCELIQDIRVPNGAIKLIFRWMDEFADDFVDVTTLRAFRILETPMSHANEFFEDNLLNKWEHNENFLRMLNDVDTPGPVYNNKFEVMLGLRKTKTRQDFGQDYEDWIAFWDVLDRIRLKECFNPKPHQYEHDDIHVICWSEQALEALPNSIMHNITRIIQNFDYSCQLNKVSVSMMWWFKRFCDVLRARTKNDYQKGLPPLEVEPHNRRLEMEQRGYQQAKRVRLDDWFFYNPSQFDNEVPESRRVCLPQSIQANRKRKIDLVARRNMEISKWQMAQVFQDDSDDDADDYSNFKPDSVKFGQYGNLKHQH